MLCKDCHKKEHAVQGWQGGNPLTMSFVEVCSVYPTGEVKMVYDLSVESEEHNFVANDIVVHNCFSRNSASSRAIPVSRVVEMVRKNPAAPVRFGKNQAGMQDSGEDCDYGVYLEEYEDSYCPQDAWNIAARSASKFAEAFADAGYHKQVCNRLTEPFQWMKVVLTATELDNWFYLRKHKDADPTIKELAEKMWEEYSNNQPYELDVGDWHVPYYGAGYWFKGKSPDSLEDALAISSSCCAQVSYRLLDNSLEKARDIYKRLVESKPVHASPFEHCATPMSVDDEYKYQASFYEWPEGVTHQDKNGDLWSGNFKGWVQYRQLIKDNVCNKYVPE
jgi:hypothetical protein